MISFFICTWSQESSACTGLKWSLGSQPQIEVGLQQWEQQILDTRPMVSIRVLALWLCRKEFPRRGKVVKQVKYLLGGKQSTAHTGGLRERVAELCPCGSLNYFYGAFLPGFLWPIILICLGHSPYLAYLRALPWVCTHLLAKMDLTKEAYG